MNLYSSISEENKNIDNIEKAVMCLSVGKEPFTE